MIIHAFLLPLQRAPPLVQRFVPFMAVAAANAVNIPMTRQMCEIILTVTLHLKYAVF
jgi:hypothetical protein